MTASYYTKQPQQYAEDRVACDPNMSAFKINRLFFRNRKKLPLLPSGPNKSEIKYEIHRYYLHFSNLPMD